MNNICPINKIPCPYALSIDSPLPCFVPSQEDCNKYIEKWNSFNEQIKKDIKEGRLELVFSK